MLKPYKYVVRQLAKKKKQEKSISLTGRNYACDYNQTQFPNQK